VIEGYRVDQAPGQPAQMVRAVVKAQAQREGQGDLINTLLAAAAGVVQLLDRAIHPGRQGYDSRGGVLHLGAP